MNNKKLLKAPISYQGSKARELDIIEKYQPKKFDKLIDAFGGGGSVSIYYTQKYPDIEVYYNDLSPDLFELFTILQNEEKSDNLAKTMNSIIPDQQDYTERNKKLKDSFKKNETDLINFIYCSSYGFRGNMFAGILNFDSKGKIKKKKNFDNFKEYPAILKKMHISKLDALFLIDKYKDDPNAFIYLDPPYLGRGTNNDGYRSISLDVNKKLCEYIKNKDIKCKIMLHIDFTGWIYAQMHDYIKYYYPPRYNMRNGNLDDVKCYKSYACIITNY